MSRRAKAPRDASANGARSLSPARSIGQCGAGAVLCLTLLACSTGAGAPSSSPTTRVADRIVYIRNHSGANEFVFQPHTITIRRGTRVTWINRSAQPHTVTASGRHPAFDSGTQKLINPSHRYSVVFRHAGRFHYYCLLHPYMTGVVIVR